MDDDEQLDDAEIALWQAHRRSAEAVGTGVERAVATASGLTGAEFGVLDHLRMHDGALRQVELATSMGWQKSRLSHQVTRMQERGLVVRLTGGPSTATVRATDAGHAALDRALPAHARAVRGLLVAAVPADQRDVVTNVLERTVTGAPEPTRTTAAEQSAVLGEHAPQQERGRVRRTLILEAAARVFDRLGYGTATLAEIARDAALGQGAIYFYFRTKEAIALAVMEEQTTRTFAAMVSPPGLTSPTERIIASSRSLADRLLEDPVIRAGMRLSLEQGVFAEPTSDFYDQWITRVVGRFEDADAAGELRATVSPTTMAASIVPYFTGAQLVSNVRTGRTDLDQALGAMWSVVIHAAVADEHRERILAAARSMFPHG